MKILLLIGVSSLVLVSGLVGCTPRPISNRPPVALFTLSWLDNLSIELDASLSYDPDGQIALYQWDFGDGTSAASPFTRTYHRYEPGRYRVSLQVTDEERSSASFVREIVVVTDKTLSFETIIKENNMPSRLLSPLEFVMRTEDELESLWQHLGLSPTPAVDFTSEIAIFVFLGERSNANYTVEVTKVIAAGGKLTVYYQETEPGIYCIILPKISYPFHVIKAERADLPAVFVKEQKILQCH